MDYANLNSIVDGTISFYPGPTMSLGQVAEAGKVVYDEEEKPITSTEWSRNDVSLEESINVIYEFFLTVDKYMASQFLNILGMKDENGNPYVRIKPRKDYPNVGNGCNNGYVNLFYDNTPNDYFIIIHELIHKMNDYTYISDYENMNEAKNYCAEIASFLGEKLLGKYLLEKGIITENDYNLRMNFKLANIKEQVKTILFENELVKLRKSNVEISDQSLLEVLSNLEPGSLEKQVLEDELKDRRRMTSILSYNQMLFPSEQRYIMGHVGSEFIMKRENPKDELIKFNQALGDGNLRIDDALAMVIFGDYSSRTL